MALGELEFVVKIREDLNRQLKQLESQIANSAAGMGREFQKTSQATSGLTKFVREQRQEQRLQNFLFREGSQTIGAIALGLSIFSNAQGEADQGSKKLSKSLNEAFLAFQGINFALSGFGPKVSLIGGAIAGLGAGIARFANDTEEALNRVDLKVKRFVDGLKGANEAQLKSRRALLESDLARLRSEISEADKGTVVTEKVTGRAAELSGSGTRERVIKDEELLRILREQELATLKEIDAINKGLPAPYEVLNRKAKEAADHEKRRLEQLTFYRDAIVALDKTRVAGEAQVQGIIARAFPIQASITKTISDRLALHVLLRPEEFRSLEIAERKLRIAELTNREQAKVPETRPQSLDTDLQQFILSDPIVRLTNELERLGVTADNVNSQIINSTQGAAAAITDAMFGATQSIEQFFETMAKNIVQTIIEELLKNTILRFLSSILGSVFGGGLPGGKPVDETPQLTRTTPGRVPVEGRTARGRVSEEPQTVVNVNVPSTQARVFTVPDRRQTVAVVADAILTGKWA